MTSIYCTFCGMKTEISTCSVHVPLQAGLGRHEDEEGPFEIQSCKNATPEKNEMQKQM